MRVDTTDGTVVDLSDRLLSGADATGPETVLTGGYSFRALPSLHCAAPCGVGAGHGRVERARRQEAGAP
jgi:hypothetical protein